MTEVKVIKLINGDEILARVKDEGNDSIELDKPMTLQPVPTAVQGAMGMALVPWLLTGKSEKIKISISHVLVIDNAKDDVEKNYLSSISGLAL